MNYRQRLKKGNDVIPLLIRQLETETIEILVNKLLENLYIPVKGKLADEGMTFCTDKEKLEKYGLDDEPINWSNLSVEEVIKIENEDRFEDRFIAKIEEAAPDGCPNLCGYIANFMSAWGWDVQVKTDW